MLSGAMAYAVYANQEMFSFVIKHFFVLVIAELAVVLALTFLIKKMNFLATVASYLLYAFLSGVTFSVIFAAFQLNSIISIFMITAIMFGVMSIYGYATKADLTSAGQLLIMALIGIIIASLVNLFFKNQTMDYIISFFAVLIFTGLIAYDTQKLKQLGQEASMYENSIMGKAAIIGALTLYLDFVNLFLHLLNLFGKRKN